MPARKNSLCCLSLNCLLAQMKLVLIYRRRLPRALSARGLQRFNRSSPHYSSAKLFSNKSSPFLRNRLPRAMRSWCLNASNIKNAASMRVIWRKFANWKNALSVWKLNAPFCNLSNLAHCAAPRNTRRSLITRRYNQVKTSSAWIN